MRRATNGMVLYSMDVVIVKPIDPAKGSGKIFYDVVNRGNNLSYSTFNQAPAPSKTGSPTPPPRVPAS